MLGDWDTLRGRLSDLGLNLSGCCLWLRLLGHLGGLLNDLGLLRHLLDGRLLGNRGRRLLLCLLDLLLGLGRLIEAHFETVSQRLKVGNASVELAEVLHLCLLLFLDFLLLFLLLARVDQFVIVRAGLDLIQLILLRLVHGFEAFGECFQQAVHTLGHLRVEVGHLGVDVLHLLLCGQDLISRPVQILLVRGSAFLECLKVLLGLGGLRRRRRRNL